MKTTGYIFQGVYYKDGKPGVLRDARNSTDKNHEIDRQRADHARDLLQPFINGKPNEAFREQYPEEAQKYYGND